MMPAGTASNESLHAELNRWWKNSPEQFPTTLQLHLSIGHIGKLLAHNAAMYSPTLRQVSHDQVLALAVRGVRFGEEDWRTWCEDGLVAEIPLFKEREVLSARLTAAGTSVAKTKTQYAVRKKPAGLVYKKPAASVEAKKVNTVKSHTKLRRTPFTLKRCSL